MEKLEDVVQENVHDCLREGDDDGKKEVKHEISDANTVASTHLNLRIKYPNKGDDERCKDKTNGIYSIASKALHDFFYRGVLLMLLFFFVVFLSYTVFVLISSSESLDQLFDTPIHRLYLALQKEHKRVQIDSLSDQNKKLDEEREHKIGKVRSSHSNSRLCNTHCQGKGQGVKLLRQEEGHCFFKYKAKCSQVDKTHIHVFLEVSRK
mmetsp:Transcript_848/g.1595  ORF Transcript_848/g.1595 Transcript_848/m.1595 type:complete len:208 (-) Transcript_848:491-1114(-)